MKKLILIAAPLALAACAKPAEEPVDNTMAEDNAMAETDVTPAADPNTLNGTTWTFTDEDQGDMVESVDADGNYILETASGDHVDHGTVAMVDGKACFTSAMAEDPQAQCWTVSPHAVGESQETTNDDGESLTVTRVEYKEMSMPS